MAELVDALDSKSNGSNAVRVRVSLCPPKFMNLDKFNSLIELFFYQSDKQKPDNIFLEWLNPNNKKIYTWKETKENILKLSKKLKETVKDGDRCLLVSENRPEWLISDLAIMLAGGITVPAYTTYTEEDYKYLIEDCEPSLM